MYLSAGQVSILANAYKHTGYVASSMLSARSGLKLADVHDLYERGFLSLKDKKYCSNKKTEIALADHGFLLDQIPIQPKKKKEPKKELSKDDIFQMLESKGLSTFVNNPKTISAINVELAKKSALAGDPFPYIRIQMPELVIKDKITLAYFAKYCDRKDNLDLRLDDKQVHFIKMAFNPTINELAIKGCTSPGKGFVTALVVNLFYDIYSDSRIVLLGPSFDHAKEIMFNEVCSIRKRMKSPYPCRVLTEGFKDPDNPKHTLMVANPDSGESLSGRHGGRTYFIFDECSGVPEELYVNSQKQARLIICISNPRALSGWFYDLYPKVDGDRDQIISDRGRRRAVVTFGGRDCLNVKAKRLHSQYTPPGGLEFDDLDGVHHYIPEGVEIPDELKKHVEALIPGQMDYAKYNAIMQKPDPIERAWSGDGCFPPEDLDYQILPPSWLVVPSREWENRNHELGVSAFALDLAASIDGDETCLTFGEIRGIKGILTCRKANTMDTVSWVLVEARKLGVDIYKGEAPIAIDVIGSGGNAIADMMESNGAVVIRINSSKTSDINPQLYANKRSEIYSVFADRLNPNSSHLDTFLVPNDQKLFQELCAHEKLYAADGIRYNLTPKSENARTRNVQTIKQKIGRSPDRADSVVMCFQAILESSGALHVPEQFNPSKVITSKVELPDGKFLATYANGDENVIESVPEDIFSSEEYIAAYNEALKTFSR